VCDLEELYRSLVDDFVISYCRSLSAREFILKTEQYSASRKAKREYLNEAKTGELTKQLNQYFEKTKIEIPRIRRGQQQEIETLINEEALLLAQYLRNEKQTWKPRIVNISILV
jgi:23S rRNA pseudoU1915 N3-methylase RlmH